MTSTAAAHGRSAGTQSGVRRCTVDDLPQVVRLYERVMRSGAGQPPPGLCRYFQRTLFEHPWVDPEIPSLVYEHAGRIAGFLGSHVRRLVLNDEPIRMGCAGQFVADPDMQKRGIGALLLRRYLAGPQDLSITDGATESVARMWVGLGGHRLWLNSLAWLRVFRPCRTAQALFGPGRRAPARGLGRAAAAPVDAVIGRMARRVLGVPVPDTRAEELSPQSLLTLLPALVRGKVLYPAYDPPFLDWLLSELEAVQSRGDLVKRLVRSRDGRLLGCYVAYVGRGRVAQVVQLAAAPADVEAVLHHLLHHARQSGAAALQGRLEPHLFGAVSSRRYLLRRTQAALVHSRSAELLAAVFEGRALLTRMEGEWWMSHHLDTFD